MQPEPFGLYPFVLHRQDFFLERDDVRKFAVDVGIVYAPLTPNDAVTNSAAVGAAAELGAVPSGASMLVLLRKKTSTG